MVKVESPRVRENEKNKVTRADSKLTSAIFKLVVKKTVKMLVVHKYPSSWLKNSFEQKN